MLSIPPATTMPAEPAAIASIPIMIAFMPEPHILLTVEHGVASGIPAPIDA